MKNIATIDCLFETEEIVENAVSGMNVCNLNKKKNIKSASIHNDETDLEELFGWRQNPLINQNIIVTSLPSLDRNNLKENLKSNPELWKSIKKIIVFNRENTDNILRAINESKPNDTFEKEWNEKIVPIQHSTLDIVYDSDSFDVAKAVETDFAINKIIEVANSVKTNRQIIRSKILNIINRINREQVFETTVVN